MYRDAFGSSLETCHTPNCFNQRKPVMRAGTAHKRAVNIEEV
jgi:hypothetical protein